MPGAKDAKDWAKEHFRGIFFGNTTPFTEDLQLDEDGLRRNLRYCAELGASGLGAGGPLGEPFALSISERKRIHEILAEEAKALGVVSYAYPVASGVATTVELAQHAANVGCDLVMVNVPFEWMKTDDMIFTFYEIVSNEAPDIGIMLYDTPHSGYLLPMELKMRIAALPTVCCSKVSGRSLTENIEHLEALSEMIMVSGGTFMEWPEYAKAGFPMPTPSSASYLMQAPAWRPLSDIYDRFVEGKLREGCDLHEKVRPLGRTRRDVYAALYDRMPGREEHPVAGIKVWQDFVGMTGGDVRPPTSPVSRESRSHLLRQLTAHVAAGILKVDR